MVNLIEEERLNAEDLKILEPACGICQFLHGMRRNKRHIFARASRRVGVEINGEIVKYVYEHGLNGDIEVVLQDYLLWETHERFDLIIGNPPYGIPSLTKHYAIKVDNRTKQRYRAIYETWYGKYNVYGAFIERSVKLLKEGGQMILIVPATFMLLDEFKKLRKFLSRNGRTEIIYMGSDVFKPEANITTVALKFIKSSEEKGYLLLYDYENGGTKLLLKSTGWNGEIVLFFTEFSKTVDKICRFRLGDVYDIRISPRTPEIKNHPNVVKCEGCAGSESLLPILNSRNLKAGEVVYEPKTGYWIEGGKKTRLRKFFDRPHIVVGLGFKGDGRLAAAYDHKAYPWMGDVYHLLRKRTLVNMGFGLRDEEVVDFLNSEIVGRYVKDVFRDITYHFNITQLKLLPLLTESEVAKLKETQL